MRGLDHRSYVPPVRDRACDPREHNVMPSLFHYCSLCRDTGRVPFGGWKTPTEVREEPHITL